ncbi:uncharacterized protein PG986_014498 [Apiospora aurea]|uniref:Uncharacterized protein n=1 Tax=Apiospora aurea TaxID=335848 RepID=A0ABR1PTP3_9PEZI
MAAQSIESLALSVPTTQQNMPRIANAGPDLPLQHPDGLLYNIDLASFDLEPQNWDSTCYRLQNNDLNMILDRKAITSKVIVEETTWAGQNARVSFSISEEMLKYFSINRPKEA